MTADSGSERVDLAMEADFRLGGLQVQPSTRQVGRDGAPETLEPRVMQVLVALARRQGQVVSRDQLIEMCWEGRIVSNDALNRCISKIRKLAEAHGAFTIEAIPRVGYRLTAGGAQPARADEAAPSKQAAPPALALLPFTNRSGLPEDEVFAEGMVEDLIDALSQGVQVRVLGSVVTASLKKDSLSDLAGAGKKLGVDFLLDGNVRRSGDTLRVTAQLLEAASGEIVWSGRFDRPLSEMAALQEELVTDLAGALTAEVHVIDMQNALRKPGALTAWEAVSRAMAAMRSTDPASLMRAVQESQRAVEIDPDYGPAHGLLAASSALIYQFLSPDDPQKVDYIRGLAERAIAKAQGKAFALVNAAGAFSAIGLPEEALRPLAQALRMAPYLGPAHYVSGVTYYLLNRIEESLHHLDMAERLLPVTYMVAYIKQQRANALIRAGRWAEAEAELDDVIAMSPESATARATKAVLCWLSQRREIAVALFQPIRNSGMTLEQVVTLYRRVYANAAPVEDILAAIPALWGEPG